MNEMEIYWLYYLFVSDRNRSCHIEPKWQWSESIHVEAGVGGGGGNDDGDIGDGGW